MDADKQIDNEIVDFEGDEIIVALVPPKGPTLRRRWAESVVSLHLESLARERKPLPDRATLVEHLMGHDTLPGILELEEDETPEE